MLIFAIYHILRSFDNRIDSTSDLQFRNIKLSDDLINFSGQAYKTIYVWYAKTALK